jgi:hypothetical protein
VGVVLGVRGRDQRVSGWKKSFADEGTREGRAGRRVDAWRSVLGMRDSSQWKGVSGRYSLVVRLLVEGSASREITSEAEMAELGLVI